MRIFKRFFSALKIIFGEDFPRKNLRGDREAYSHTSEGARNRFLPKNTDKNKIPTKKRGSLIEELPLVMLLSEARQTNRSRIERILTRRDYINTVQLSYFACRTFIFHITSPYTNKSITDCIIIIYDIFYLVNTFFIFFINRYFFAVL